jgi:diaminopimelate decarboxylase
MDHFSYRNKQLYAEEVSVAAIAEQWGTPSYIYSRATLERHWQVFDQALGAHPHQICYAVKANSNIAVLNILARLGSGFDIVSVGELERVLAAGGDPHKIVFSGVGKLPFEIERALAVDIACFNVESKPELEQINQIAQKMGKKAAIAIRVNPDINAGSHPYISTGLKENKFGVNIDEALALYIEAAQLSHIKIVGIACHIGSQLTELSPFIEALERLLILIEQLQTKGIRLEHLDLGGGLGIRYHQENPPSPAEYAKAILKKLGTSSLKIFLEPGRAIAGNAGILVTQVIYLKQSEHKNFAIVDAAMNDLLRPSLYEAWQNIIPITLTDNPVNELYDVVGPVCETGDFLGKNRELALNQGDLLAIRTAGAYGFTMSSNYNSRPRIAELMVDGDQVHLIRRRETIAELFALENIIS